jgi:hypothetical protein
VVTDHTGGRSGGISSQKTFPIDIFLLDSTGKLHTSMQPARETQLARRQTPWKRNREKHKEGAQYFRTREISNLLPAVLHRPRRKKEDIKSSEPMPTQVSTVQFSLPQATQEQRHRKKVMRQRAGTVSRERKAKREPISSTSPHPCGRRGSRYVCRFRRSTLSRAGRSFTSFGCRTNGGVFGRRRYLGVPV